MANDVFTSGTWDERAQEVRFVVRHALAGGVVGVGLAYVDVASGGTCSKTSIRLMSCTHGSAFGRAKYNMDVRLSYSRNQRRDRASKNSLTVNR